MSVLDRVGGRAPRPLGGRVAAVTGGARGIGLATVVALRDAGLKVALGDLDADLAADVAGRLGPDVVGLPLDVTDRESFELFLAAAQQRLGPVEVLVSNAGVMPLASQLTESDAAMDRTLDVNVRGVMLGCRLALPAMVARGEGHLVTIASSAGKVGLAGAATYSASKHAVVGYSAALREETRGTGVEVTVVMPGLVDTELSSGTTATRGIAPVQPDDVAAAVVRALRRPRFEGLRPPRAGSAGAHHERAAGGGARPAGRGVREPGRPDEGRRGRPPRLRGPGGRRGRPHRSDGLTAVPEPLGPHHPAAWPGGTLLPDPVDWRALRRVVAVRPDNLGDVVLAEPALRALRAALPDDATLELLTSPAGAAVAPLLEPVDAVKVVERPSWQQAGPPDPARPATPDDDVVDLLRGADAVVVLTSFSQSPWPVALLAQRADVPVRVGMSAEFGGPALTHWVLPPADSATQHQVDRQLHLLREVGVDPVDGPTVPRGLVDAVRGRPAATWAPDRPRLADPTGSSWSDPTREMIESLDAAGAVDFGIGVEDSRYAVLLPGASCSSRRWPAERFAGVARRLLDDVERVVVAGSRSEADLVDAVVTGSGRHQQVLGAAGVLDVGQLCALLRQARVVVANNSGGAHLCEALDVPLVELFAGTETPSQYAPRHLVAAGLARVLTVPVACSPCRRFVCPYEQQCLDVGVDDVLAAVADVVPPAARPPGSGAGE